MDMSSMSSSSSSSSMPMTMSSSQMSMTFFASPLTPLYSPAWTPTTPGAYGATCTFLILLAMLFRALLALKARQERVWLDAEYARRYVVVVGKGGMGGAVRDAGGKAGDAGVGGEKGEGVKRMVLSENGVEEDVFVVGRKAGRGPVGAAAVRPWRLSVDPVRAVGDTVIAGVAYLLMLAVMTMNIGYFMSVLAGTFLGSLAIGRYAVAFEHDH